MRSFAFHRPSTLYETSALLGGVADSMPLAGGMTLLPTIKQRLAAPAALIDLSKIPQLSGISLLGDILTIGAMTRHVEVAESELVRSKIPLLASLAAGIGDPAVRNRGTIGGSVANNDLRRLSGPFSARCRHRDGSPRNIGGRAFRGCLKPR